MTDRVNSLLVVLDQDYRDDDIEVLRKAIMQMKGVINVSLNVSNSETHMSEVRAKRELGDKLWEVLYPRTLTK